MLRLFQAIPQYLYLILGGKLQNIPEVSVLKGSYSLQKVEINGKSQWRKNKGKSMWWNKDSNSWMIGNFSAKGDSNVIIKGPSNCAQPPTVISSGWCYWNRKQGS